MYVIPASLRAGGVFMRENTRCMQTLQQPSSLQTTLNREGAPKAEGTDHMQEAYQEDRVSATRTGGYIGHLSIGWGHNCLHRWWSLQVMFWNIPAVPQALWWMQQEHRQGASQSKRFLLLITELELAFKVKTVKWEYDFYYQTWYEIAAVTGRKDLYFFSWGEAPCTCWLLDFA